jgi:pyruvate/2-oxoglutarate/acetoin dehydrogenase E1 component
LGRITYTQSIVQALDEEFARDPSVFALGQDIGRYWGGPMGEFQGLFHKYGAKRIRDAPISETAMLGSGIGAAAVGMRPIIEIMFADFLGVCGDEILNQLTKVRYMFGGKVKIPLTIISYCGAGTSAGAQHSKNLEGLLMSIPGLKIVSPSTPYDMKGLLKSAIRDDNPVICFLNKTLMHSRAQSDVPDKEYVIPLGKADVKREGKDVTVVAIGLMVHRALAAANKLDEKGISIEVIDPRTIVPLDKQAIITSVKKTGRVVIIDEEPKTGSAAAEIGCIVAEEAFEFLTKPVRRVCAPDTPIPFSPILEQLWMPSEDNLIEAVTAIT